MKHASPAVRARRACDARSMADWEHSLVVEGELSDEVRDPAELQGLPQRISNLGLTLLSASTIDEKDFGPETVGTSTGAVAGTKS
jgi:hypothetical protein